MSQVQAPGAKAAGSTQTADPIIRVENVKKHFPITQGIIFKKKIGAVHAVDGVSFEVYPGETLGLVGESGCGKSTTARLVTRLLDVTSGRIFLEGEDITSMKQKALRPLRREMQMIFQDPYASLNPRKTVGQIIGAPYDIHKTEGETRRKVQD
ncbi:MAG: ATP-binding cassette domain-containing protein, partial [Actinomycetota bacterium]|nr:ATP-binding cassette domain-containing protein [Actinomycetota bacterium]